MREGLPANFLVALLALRIPHEESCAIWSYQPEYDTTPACNCQKAAHDRAVNGLIDSLKRWGASVGVVQDILEVIALGVVTPKRRLPAPWDATTGRALLALVDPGSPGELLHAIDLLGGAVTADALPRGKGLKVVGLTLQVHGYLRLARFAGRPRTIVGEHNTLCVLWEITPRGLALLAELRAARLPRFGWVEVAEGWLAAKPAGS